MTITKGPWFVVDTRSVEEGEIDSLEILNAERPNTLCANIATVWGGLEGFGDNARLIAAAPDLLASLKELMSETRDHELGLAVIERAQAAIAKAEWTKGDA